MSFLKRVLPDRDIPLKILGGPFRGGVFFSNPRNSMRKIVGLYEHELNPWLSKALRRTEQFIDVGANDGYFTSGCVAAMKRQGRPVRGIAFEPSQDCIVRLHRAVENAGLSNNDVIVINKFAGSVVSPEFDTLDHCVRHLETSKPTLIKIDVEGAEADVIKGGERWLVPSAMFVIEVHSKVLIETVTELFNRRGLKLALMHQRGLPIIGCEQRDADNWWLISELV